MAAAQRRVLGAVLLTAAGIVTAASLMPLAASFWWLADLFSHFRLQMLVATIVTMAAVAMTRWKLAALALVPAGLLNLIPLSTYLIPAARPASAASTLRVMSANLFFRNDSYAGLVDTVERETPDIVLFVEYTPSLAHGLAGLDALYPYRTTLPRRRPTGIALLSRYPIAESRIFDLGPWPAIEAHVATPDGPIRVLGVHLLPPTDPERWRLRNEQLDDLASVIGAEEGATVLAGDFNLSPYSVFYRRLAARTGLTDAFAGHGVVITWPSFAQWLGTKIDHVMISGNLAAVSDRRVPLPGSDHYAIIADLTRK
jgi:endonuclease/exonuclease/phosphatase (EEP) superfamily protein YafD